MRTGATFRVGLIGVEDVTAALGIAPTPSEPPVAGWRLSTEVRGGVELAVPILQLLEVLEPAAQQLAELRRRGAEFDFFCYLGSYAAEHAAVLSPSLLSRIAALDAELWLDVYGERPPDLPSPAA